MKKKIIPFLIVALMLTSCMTTKTNVGAFRENEGSIYTYAKGKQVWIFWGLLPVGRTKVNTPGDGDCQVVTRFNVADVLVNFFTGGFVKTYTIKVNAKKKTQTQQSNPS